MTVTIRPVPSRVAGNRIVPFGRVQYTYKPNPVGLRDWKPPVPEPLKPAPLLDLKTLALLGLQALAWWWGQLNSRPKTFEPSFTEAIGPVKGTLPPDGNTTPGTLTITRSGGSQRYAINNCNIFQNNTTGGFTSSYTDVLSVVITTSLSNQCAGRMSGKTATITRTADRVVELLIGLDRPYGYIYNTDEWSFDWAGPDAAEITPVGTTFPVPDGYVVPQVEPEPEPAVAPPAPLPLPLPSTVPQVEPSTEPDALPAPSPLVPITPGPVAPPIIRPATPYSPQPPKLPAPTATSNGTVVAPAPVPVPTTPQDAIFPVPGGLPVTGRTMTPTIQAVAQEVGRIEQKIDRMVNPGPGQWGDVPGAGDLVADAVKALVEAVIAISSGTTYTLDSPCEVDEETGEKLPPVTVAAPGGLTTFGTILNRIDAIAELLQVHKNLKQPNCKPKQPTGEWVTVNFEQID